MLEHFLMSEFQEDLTQQVFLVTHKDLMHESVVLLIFLEHLPLICTETICVVHDNVYSVVVESLEVDDVVLGVFPNRLDVARTLVAVPNVAESVK